MEILYAASTDEVIYVENIGGVESIRKPRGNPSDFPSAGRSSYEGGTTIQFPGTGEGYPQPRNTFRVIGAISGCNG